MTSRERVLTALEGGIPDRVPWVESYVHSSLVNTILGRVVRPIKGSRFATEIHEKLCLDNVTFDFRPPIYAEKEMRGDLEMIRKGKLKTWADLEAMEEWLPDPSEDAFYADAEQLLKQKGEHAAVAGLRLGFSNVYNSMGYEDFVYALYDRPDFVIECFKVVGAWCQKVIDRVNEMDFDLAWIGEDIAYQDGIVVTVAQYEKYIFPLAKSLAEQINIPKVYHSDGNFNDVLELILQLNPSGIANLEPPAMDIFGLKQTHGHRVCLVGNIDLHYTLTRGTEEETRTEVREKIERVGKNGGYIVASANGLASYCKPENVVAMHETILEYGYY